MMRRGFTLLEVLVAIAILGIGLTVILSSQAGLFSSSQRAANLSLATGLARCHMNEVELKLIKEGYPFIDAKDEGPCCHDEYSSEFRCSSIVERVELPDLSQLPEGEEDSDPLGLTKGKGLLGGSDPTDLASAAGSLGPLGGLADLKDNGVGALAGDASLGGFADLLGGGGGEEGGGGMGGLISMVMTMVYPNLKLMLEASIRRVTVVVHWKEGSFERDLTLVQFVTSPQQGGFDPFAEERLDAAQDALGGAGIPGGATGSTGSTTTGGLLPGF